MITVVLALSCSDGGTNDDGDADEQTDARDGSDADAAVDPDATPDADVVVDAEGIVDADTRVDADEIVELDADAPQDAAPDGDVPVGAGCPVGLDTDGGNLFYVDPALGDNDNDGSEASPWQSIQYVVDNLVDCLDQDGVPKNPGAPASSRDTSWTFRWPTVHPRSTR